MKVQQHLQELAAHMDAEHDHSADTVNGDTRGLHACQSSLTDVSDVLSPRRCAQRNETCHDSNGDSSYFACCHCRRFLLRSTRLRPRHLRMSVAVACHAACHHSRSRTPDSAFGERNRGEDTSSPLPNNPDCGAVLHSQNTRPKTAKRRGLVRVAKTVLF